MQTDAVSVVTHIVAKALGLPDGRVKVEDTIDTHPEWDSLGHLNILTALERQFGGQVAAIQGLAKATSVRAIIELLQSHRVI